MQPRLARLRAGRSRTGDASHCWRTTQWHRYRVEWCPAVLAAEWSAWRHRHRPRFQARGRLAIVKNTIAYSGARARLPTAVATTSVAVPRARLHLALRAARLAPPILRGNR